MFFNITCVLELLFNYCFIILFTAKNLRYIYKLNNSASKIINLYFNLRDLPLFNF